MVVECVDLVDDQGLISVADIVNNATGVSVNQYETNRAGFTAAYDIKLDDELTPYAGLVYTIDVHHSA